ncbi:hypothetical protein N9992_00705 [bacterium]|nr:hypothetical protein [bacterium]
MAKDILKEAIADAKAVREVALANAKAALEEAFTPKLQSMLSAKLSEDLTEEYDEDEKVDEMYYDEDEDGDMDEVTGMEMDEDEATEESVEETTDLDEEIDLEEILNELELEEGEVSEETVEEATEEVDETIEEAKDDEEEDLDEVHKPHYEADDVQKVNPTADYVHEGEEFNLDALLEEINNLDENNEDEVNEEVEEVEEGLMDTLKKAGSEAYKNIFPAEFYDSEGKIMWSKVAQATGDAAATAKREGVEEELEETKAALETVRTELNEVNLLNSKLLYVNRIFKANTLDEAQKLRVVETLDKAESAKEAKLIYETIKDTFNVAKSKKESFKNKTKSLQEGLGMASKAAGTSTAPKKEVIAESTNMVSRFQKLANITINE